MTERIIVRSGGQPVRCAWPEGTFLQGGDPSWREPGDDTFVEAFPPAGGFFRGDAPTIEEAEAKAFAKYSRSVECPGHQWEARGYTNGGGICRLCGVFGSKVFTGVDLGQFCHTCGVGTTWGTYSLDAYWDPAGSFTGVVSPEGSEQFWFCQQHAPFRAEIAARNAEREQALAEMTGRDIEDLLGALSDRLTKDLS